IVLHNLQSSPRVTFLVGIRDSAAIENDVAGGKRPRTEYSVFAARNGSPVLTYDDVRVAPEPLPRALLRRHQAHWSLGALALQRKAADPVITSGDDIWVRFLIQCLLRRSGKRSYNIVHGSYFASSKFKALMRLFGRMRHAHLLTLSDSLRRMLV